MSWTPPQTWVASQLVTASDLNVDLRDNLYYLYDRANTDVDTVGSTQTVTNTSFEQMGSVSVTLTTIGNPVLLIAELEGLRVDDAAHEVNVQWYNASASANVGVEYTCKNADYTPASLTTIDQRAPGTYTWYLRWKVDVGTVTGYCLGLKLHAVELL